MTVNHEGDGVAPSTSFRDDILRTCGAALQANLPDIMQQPGGLRSHLMRLVGDARLGDMVCAEDMEAAASIIMGDREAGVGAAGAPAEAGKGEGPPPPGASGGQAVWTKGLAVAFRHVPDDCLEEAGHRLLLASGDRSSAAVNYHHPAENGAYLEAEVLPLLREGLVAMMQQAEAYSVDLAGGAFWVDGWRADDWKPLNMLRWLSQWLAEHADAVPPAQATAAAVVPGPSTELDRPGIITECFLAMDADQTGLVEASALRTILEVAGGSTADAEGQANELTRPFLERDSPKVSRTEFESVMQAGTASVPDASFLQAVKRGLKDRLWVLLPKKYQYMALFGYLDKEGAGWLEMEELLRICRSLGYAASNESTEEQAEYKDPVAALTWLDTSPGSKATASDLFASLDTMASAVGEPVFQERLVDKLVDLDHENTPEEHGPEEDDVTF
eukprot:jgi/Mesvir1/6878/Mv09046-RA.1